MRDEIKQYLEQNRATADAGDFADDESLLEAGVIDSMTMVDLISFLESTFSIQIDEDDMIPENFDSVNAIVEYVTSKQGAAS